VGGPSLGGEGGEDSYLASVSDLMVGMLFVFIVMLMAFALNMRGAQEGASRTRAELENARGAVAEERDRLAAERDELARRHAAVSEVAERLLARDRTRAALLEGLALDLGERAVPVVLDARNGVLRLPESLLFDSGSAALRPEGERALRELAAALAAALPCHSRAPPAAQARCGEGSRPLLEAVLIEGHTDDVPLRHGGGTFGDNWQLSAARGVSTFKALTLAAPGLEELENTRGEALLGVAGYEARRPVAAGDAPETRRLNRRIDLRFIVAAPGETELAGMGARRRVAEGGGR
jgi:flagellar motor protein MotB